MASSQTDNREGDNDRTHDIRIKLLTLGQSGVGKGSLMCRYGKDQFPPDKELKRKQGIYFKVKYVSIDGKRIKVQIWDTAGQERFRAITMSYFKATQGVLLVYDVTDRESFMKVETWITEIHRSANKQVSKVIVGNKADMEIERVVTEEEGRKLAQKNGVPFYEVSAKDSCNVTEVFNILVKLVKDRLEANETGAQSIQGRVNLRPTDDQKKSTCYI